MRKRKKPPKVRRVPSHLDLLVGVLENIGADGWVLVRLTDMTCLMFHGRPTMAFDAEGSYLRTSVMRP